MKEIYIDKKSINKNTCSFLNEIITKSASYKSVKEYLNYLNYQISKIKSGKRRNIYNRMINGSNNEFTECVSELTFQSLWEHFDWKYVKDKLIDNKTPDYHVSLPDNSNFIAEITTLRSNHPHDDIIVSRKKGIIELFKKIIFLNKYKPKLIIKNNSTGEFLEKLPLAINPIQQDSRINVEINQKYKKYYDILVKNNLPMVICFYKPDFNSSFFIDKFQIQTALFGNQKINWENGDKIFEPQITNDKYGNTIVKGIFASDYYSHISAVIFIKKEFSTSKEKYVFNIEIFINPLSTWNLMNNPFSSMGLNVNYVDNENMFRSSEASVVELY